MKIEKFNLSFLCDKGKWEVEEATKFPTKEMFEKTIEILEGLGLGKTKKIVIDIM